MEASSCLNSVPSENCLAGASVGGGLQRVACERSHHLGTPSMDAPAACATSLSNPQPHLAQADITTGAPHPRSHIAQHAAAEAQG